MALRNILLLTSDAATVKSVSAALSTNGQLVRGDVFADVIDLSHRLKSVVSPAVLVDIDAQPKKLLEAMEPLARKFSDTNFVVLSGVMREDLILDAMQAGARQFMLKDNVAANLHDVLHRLCKNAERQATGKVVTILSAGGGCGATTVAVNLSAELQALPREAEADESEEEAKPALAVDLDPSYGALSTYLSADSEYGIFDLLGRTGALDQQLIQSTSVQVSKQLRVMVGLRRSKLGEAVTFDPARLAHMVELCSHAYPWTIIDAPRLPLSAAADLIRHSGTSLLLMQLTVKDIHVARQMLNGLLERGIPQSAVKIIATRYSRRGAMIALPEAEKALGMEKNSLATLSNDFSAVTEAVNLGKPLLETAPRSTFRRELQALAGRIGAGELSGAVAMKA